MKEIIEEALVKFGLNRAISKEEKEEAKRTFIFRREEFILYFRKEKEYRLAITDWGIYYEQFDSTNWLKFRFNRYDISWYEIESIKYDIKDLKDYKFTFQLKGNKKCDIYLTSDNSFLLLDRFFEDILIERVRIKIRQALLQNNIKEAIMFLEYFKVDKEESTSRRYIDYLFLSIEVYKKSNNFYKVAQIYEELEELKKGDLEAFSKYNKEREENYKKYVNNFKGLPLQDRNIITVSNTDKLFKSDHITLLNIGQLPAINFPMSHPKVNQTYIAHPYKTDSYLPIENYDYELLNDRLNEFFYILQCLGATSITFETIEEENKEEKNHSNLKAEAETKTKIAGGKVGVDYDSLMNSSLRNYLKMERTQTFDPEKRPYIPKDVVWFPNEFSWQRLAQQRLNGNFLSHNEVLSSSQTQTLSSSEIVDVNAELKMLFTSVRAGVHYQEEKEIKQNRDFSCRISVEFKPMKEFPEDTEIIDITAEEVTQTPIQLPASNDNEARYLEEIHFMLEDDGVIDERERTILERIRERYNITPERAKELEAQAIAGQELTSEEQEYLSEYKNSLQDGAISEKERRLLNRLAMALGISEESKGIGREFIK
jgi:hypothetical protein